MKPRINFFAEDGWNKFHEELEEELEKDNWTEDDQLDRERWMREGEEENDPDDIKDVL